MPRALKPQKLETYRHHKLKVSIDLFLDRNSNEFYFEYAGTTYYKPSIAQLRTQAYEIIIATSNLVWEPVIEVRRLQPFCNNTDHFVGFDVNRFWIARRPDLHWVKHDWEDHSWEKERYRTSDDPEDKSHWTHEARYFASPEFKWRVPQTDSRHDNRDIIYLPYSAITWDNLHYIQEQIVLLRNNLDDLMTTDTGLAKLEAPGIKLLGEGGGGGNTGS